MVKQVKILEIKDKLPVIHALKAITHKNTETCVNIVNKIADAGSILLLSDSYITVTQWEQVAKECKDVLKWEYLSSIRNMCDSLKQGV